MKTLEYLLSMSVAGFLILGAMAMLVNMVYRVI